MVRQANRGAGHVQRVGLQNVGIRGVLRRAGFDASGHVRAWAQRCALGSRPGSAEVSPVEAENLCRGRESIRSPDSLWPTQGNTTTRDHVAHRVDAVDLKNQLGYVETNRRDRLHVDCSRRHRQLGSRRACVPSAPSVSSLHHHPNRGPKESPSMVSLHLHAFTQSPTADRTEKLLVSPHSSCSHRGLRESAPATACKQVGSISIDPKK
jgi:hypothetical protein